MRSLETYCIPFMIGLSVAFANVAIQCSAIADTGNTTTAVAGAIVVSDKTIVPSAVPDPGMVLHLSFALKSDRAVGMDAYIRQQRDPKSPLYRKVLTPAEVGAMFGASDSDVSTVAAYASAQGFTVTHVWPSKLFISADATVAQTERAFGFNIVGYARPANLVAAGEPATFYAPDAAPVVPTAIAAKLISVTGFDNLGINHPVGLGANPSAIPVPIHPGAKAIPGAVASFSNPMQPSDVSTFYEFDPLHSAGFYGDSQSIGIFSPTSFNIGDVDKFSLDFNDFGWTLYHVNIDGGATDSNGQLEACLDTEVVIGQAHNTTIFMYEFPNLISNNIDAYNQMEADDIPVLSCSWGSSESFLHSNGYDTAVANWHTVFNEMLIQGQALYCASGDTGAVVIEPSSDPSVTAVGGTDDLVDSSAAYVSEQGWTGSGGGNSIYWGEPSYQSGPGVSNTYSNGMRQVPDISADGGPTPGYLIHATGGSGSAYYHVWGTSASTPLWAVATVLMDEGTQSLGYGDYSYNLNPFLYDIGTNLNSYRSTLPGAFVFHDVTTGNSGFPCTDAWDYVTGWGSARFWKLYADDVLSPGVAGNYPGGWSYPVGISTSSTTMTEPSEIDNLTTYYIGASYACFGPADFRAATLDVHLDGTNYDAAYGPLPVGYAWTDFPAITTSLPLGPHTINEYVNSSLIYTRSVVSRPFNDLFSHAEAISGGNGTVYGTNSYASKEPGEPNHGNNAGGASVWYLWTAPATGDFNFNTFGSNYDTTMGVYTGTSVSTLTTLAENDDFGGTYQSSVSISAVSGHQYYIAVDGYDGATGNIELNWSPVAISNFSINPPSVVGGTSTTGTITINAPGASPSGTIVKLTNSNINAAGVPTSITVASGSLSGSFTITTKTVTANKSVTVTAHYDGSSPTATLTILPPAVADIVVNPASVPENSTSTGRVDLTGPAHTGTTVKLTSSNTAFVTVPASVAVGAGATFIHFTATTLTGGSDKTVTITATYLGTTATCQLTMTVPTTLAVTNATGAIGATVNLPVTLTHTVGANPISGQTIAYTLLGGSAGSAVTNASGVATDHYTIPSSAPIGSQTVKATFATNSMYNGSTATGTLTITKADTTVTVTSVSGNPGAEVTLTAKLRRTTDNAGLGGQTVAFTVNGAASGSVTTDSTGTATKTYTIPTGASAGQETIKASFAGGSHYNASSGTATLTVN